MKIDNEFTVGVPIGEAWEAMLDLERIAPCLPGASIDEQEGDDAYKGTMAVKIGPITAKYKGTVKFEEKDESSHRAVLQATGRDARGQGTASATITSSMEEVSDGTKVSVETDMKLTGRAAQFGRGIAQDVAEKMLGQFADCLEQRLGEASEDSKEDPEGAPASPESAGNGAAEASSGEGAAATSGSNGGAMVTPGGVTPGASPGSLGAGQESTASSFARPVGSSGNGGASSGDSSPGGSSSSEEKPKEEPKARRIEQPEPEPLDLGEMSQDAVLKRVKPVLIGAGILLVVIWLLRRRN